MMHLDERLITLDLDRELHTATQESGSGGDDEAAANETGAKSKVPLRSILVFDREGSFVRSHAHVMATTIVTSAAGQTVDRWSQNEQFDPEELTIAITGSPWNAHAGAGGALVNDSGRIVIDVTTGEALVVNGPHQAFLGDFDALCDVLPP